MPRAAIRIEDPPQLALRSRWEVAYVLARLDGLDAADALRRYCAEQWQAAEIESIDRRVPLASAVRSAVRRVDRHVSAVLLAEARRRGLFGTARRVRMLPRLGAILEAADDADRLQPPMPPAAVRTPAARRLPTLDELRERWPDWSDEELLQWLQDLAQQEPAAADPGPAHSAKSLIHNGFSAKPGAAPAGHRPRRARRERIVRFSREALERLTEPQPPSAEDHLQAWLPANMAQRLAGCGLRTVHDLMVQVSRSARWHEAIPGWGRAKAALVEAWLRRHGLMPARKPAASRPTRPQATAAADIAVPDPHIAALPCPARPAATGPADASLSAFGQLAVFGHPDTCGAAGLHRLPQRLAMIDAADDLQAIASWLRTLRSDNTRRAYRREALRWALWLAAERQRAISSASVDDANDYAAFLAAVPAGWCRPRAWAMTGGGEIVWQAFEGPLAPRSAAYSVTVLRRMYRWLGDVRWLHGNPFVAVTRAQDRSGVLLDAQRRALPPDLVDLIVWRLCGQPAGDLRQSRRQLLLALLFETGLRRDEAARLRYGDLAVVEVEPPAGQTGIELRFAGKGGRQRNVPLTPRVLALMRQDLALRGLAAEPMDAACAGIGVIGPVRGDGASVGNQTVYRECLAALATLAGELEAEGRGPLAALLRQATTHWARHSFAHRVAEHASLDVVQELLGHADIRTTRVYARVNARRRAEAVARAAG